MEGKILHRMEELSTVSFRSLLQMPPIPNTAGNSQLDLNRQNMEVFVQLDCFAKVAHCTDDYRTRISCKSAYAKFFDLYAAINNPSAEVVDKKFKVKCIEIRLSKNLGSLKEQDIQISFTNLIYLGVCHDPRRIDTLPFIFDYYSDMKPTATVFKLAKKSGSSRSLEKENQPVFASTISIKPEQYHSISDLGNPAPNFSSADHNHDLRKYLDQVGNSQEGNCVDSGAYFWPATSSAMRPPLARTILTDGSQEPSTPMPMVRAEQAPPGAPLLPLQQTTPIMARTGISPAPAMLLPNFLHTNQFIRRAESQLVTQAESVDNRSQFEKVDKLLASINSWHMQGQSHLIEPALKSYLVEGVIPELSNSGASVNFQPIENRGLQPKFDPFEVLRLSNRPKKQANSSTRKDKNSTSRTPKKSSKTKTPKNKEKVIVAANGTAIICIDDDDEQSARPRGKKRGKFSQLLKDRISKSTLPQEYSISSQSNISRVAQGNNMPGAIETRAISCQNTDLDKALDSFTSSLLQPDQTAQEANQRYSGEADEEVEEITPNSRTGLQTNQLVVHNSGLRNLKRGHKPGEEKPPRTFKDLVGKYQSCSIKLEESCSQDLQQKEDSWKINGRSQNESPGPGEFLGKRVTFASTLETPSRTKESVQSRGFEVFEQHYFKISIPDYYLSPAELVQAIQMLQNKKIQDQSRIVEFKRQISTEQRMSPEAELALKLVRSEKEKYFSRLLNRTIKAGAEVSGQTETDQDATKAETDSMATSGVVGGVAEQPTGAKSATASTAHIDRLNRILSIAHSQLRKSEEQQMLREFDSTKEEEANDSAAQTETVQPAPSALESVTLAGDFFSILIPTSQAGPSLECDRRATGDRNWELEQQIVEGVAKAAEEYIESHLGEIVDSVIRRSRSRKGSPRSKAGSASRDMDRRRRQSVGKSREKSSSGRNSRTRRHSRSTHRQRQHLEPKLKLQDLDEIALRCVNSSFTEFLGDL